MNARNFKLGAYGGLAGGVVFGVMMGIMGMLTMIGKMVGHPSAVTGFLAYLVISALIGASLVTPIMSPVGRTLTQLNTKGLARD